MLWKNATAKTSHANFQNHASSPAFLTHPQPLPHSGRGAICAENQFINTFLQEFKCLEQDVLKPKKLPSFSREGLGVGPQCQAIPSITPNHQKLQNHHPVQQAGKVIVVPHLPGKEDQQKGDACGHGQSC